MVPDVTINLHYLRYSFQHAQTGPERTFGMAVGLRGYGPGLDVQCGAQVVLEPGHNRVIIKTQRQLLVWGAKRPLGRKAAL